MKVFIPQVGDKVVLTENWTCKVPSEHRNASIFEAFGIARSSNVEDTAITITIPKGTVLKFDRFYIRKPASNFDSVTFVVVDSPLEDIKKARFWVKLSEANKIECEHYELGIENAKTYKEVFEFYANKLGFDTIFNLNVEESNAILQEVMRHYPTYTISAVVPQEKLEKYVNNLKNIYTYHTHNNGAPLQEMELTIDIVPVAKEWLVFTHQHEQLDNMINSHFKRKICKLMMMQPNFTNQKAADIGTTLSMITEGGTITTHGATMEFTNSSELKTMLGKLQKDVSKVAKSKMKM